jgi:hypothetical protein
MSWQTQSDRREAGPRARENLPMSAFSRSPGLELRINTPLRDALVGALGKPAPDGEGTQIDQVVTKLIELAKNGDWRAMKEIFDRLDARADGPGEAKEPRVFRQIITGVPRPDEAG